MSDRCDCSLCSATRATRELRRDVQRALDAAMGHKPVERVACGEEPSGVPFLHFTCDRCKTEHRLRGSRVAGMRRLICSCCGVTWVRP